MNNIIMSIEASSLSPMGEILKNEWNNGWKMRCEKEIKKASFTKAFHHSAKDHVKFGQVSSEFKEFLAEFIDLGVSRKFTTRVLRILDLKDISGDLIKDAIDNVLSETSQKVEAVVSNPSKIEVSNTQLSKEDLIILWTQKGLAEAVIEETKTLPIRKAFLKVFKEYLEIHLPESKLTENLYVGIESNLSAFFKRLQGVLGTSGVSYEEIITTLYDGRETNVNNFLSFKSKSIKISSK